MTSKDLFASILQQAIKGELVNHLDSDGSAQDLIDQIENEKKRQIDEYNAANPGKKQKKYVAPSPIPDDEIPFSIPDNWKWVRLGDIFVFIDYRGKTPNKLTQGIPLVTAKNIKKGYLDYTVKDFISIDEYSERQTRGIAHKGDLLFTTEAPMGNAAIADLEEFSTGQRVITFQNIVKMVNECFMYFILSDSFNIQLENNSTGTTALGIKASKLKALLLPLPPLAEQARIVAKLEELKPMVEEYGKANDRLEALNKKLPDELKASVLQEALRGRLTTQLPSDGDAQSLIDQIEAEKAKSSAKNKKYIPPQPVNPDDAPFQIPDNWKWVRLGEVMKTITDFVASGSFASLRENVKYYDEKQYAIIVRTTDFRTNFKSSLVYTDKHGYDFLRNSNLYGGELILSNIGASIGKVFKTPILDMPMTLGPNSIMVKPFDVILNDYLYRLFQSRWWIEVLHKISASSAQAKFNKTDLKQTLIPLPPLAEQQRIVDKIEEVFGKVDALRR